MTEMYDRSYILENKDWLKFDEGCQKVIQYLLFKYIFDYDSEVVDALLSNGADPNCNPHRQYGTRNHGFLHDLIYEYKIQHTLKGVAILDVVRILLQHGANPNQPGDCNSAPIQYCLSEIMQPVRQMLIEFGADKDGNVRY